MEGDGGRSGKNGGSGRTVTISDSDTVPTNKLSFSNPTEVPDEIWLQSVMWFQRRRCLKMVDGQRTTDDGRCTTDDGRTMVHDHTISSHAAFDFGEVKSIVFTLSHLKI